MIKQILIASLALSLTSCCTNDKSANVKDNKPKVIELNNNSEYYDLQYEIYTHEGCEYIVVGAGNRRWGSHKGNCKNKIHKYDSSTSY